ncbi:MAG: FxsA family protein, partial [Methylococcales bacterium]|nr:FxsA family protein [Methylococcales bacterium]
MKAVQIIFLFFLVVPFVEIYLLLQIGGLVGVMPTVLLVVFTAVLGAWLLRRQGFATFQRFQASLAQGEIPAYEMIEGPILLVGGALLLTP